MNKTPLFPGLSALCLASLAAATSGCLAARDHVLVPHRVTNEMVLPAVTNTVWLTNAVVETRLVTNTVTQTLEPVATTTWVVSTNVTVLPPRTQTVILTNAWEPSPAALATAQGVGAAVNIFAPGAGSVVAWGLSGFLSLFAALQTRKAGNHQAAVDALGKAIEQTRVALQSAGPGGQSIATHLTDVIEGHAEAAGTSVAAIVREVATRAGGDTGAAIALHWATSALQRNATAAELVAAAQSGRVPDWFSPAERNAVERIKA